MYTDYLMFNMSQNIEESDSKSYISSGYKEILNSTGVREKIRPTSFPYGSKPIMLGMFTNANLAALPWGLSYLPPEYSVDCLISLTKGQKRERLCSSAKVT